MCKEAYTFSSINLPQTDVIYRVPHILRLFPEIRQIVEQILNHEKCTLQTTIKLGFGGSLSLVSVETQLNLWCMPRPMEHPIKSVGCQFKMAPNIFISSHDWKRNDYERALHLNCRIGVVDEQIQSTVVIFGYTLKYSFH